MEVKIVNIRNSIWGYHSSDKPLIEMKLGQTYIVDEDCFESWCMEKLSADCCDECSCEKPCGCDCDCECAKAEAKIEVEVQVAKKSSKKAKKVADEAEGE